MTFWNLGLSTKTEQEQAYLNIIHDVKTTDKDADADKLTHANTGGNTHACGTPGR